MKFGQTLAHNLTLFKKSLLLNIYYVFHYNTFFDLFLINNDVNFMSKNRVCFLVILFRIKHKVTNFTKNQFEILIFLSNVIHSLELSKAILKSRVISSKIIQQRVSLISLNKLEFLKELLLEVFI